MSNDLISRSALMQALRGNVLVDVTPYLEDAIKEQPTAYDVDKVVERLEANSMFAPEGVEPFVMLDDAVEIVKSGSIE